MDKSGRKYFTFAEPPGQIILENGSLLGPVTIAYETYGQLAADKSNVILIEHAFSGDSHVACHAEDEDEASRPGWWDNMVGPEKGIDTNIYFVVCANILGGCMGTTGPTSLNPATGKPYGLDFPVVTIADMVHVQKKLLDFLGIKQVLSVIGGSVGGMQVLQWCVSYPEMVRSAVPLATTMRHSALAIAFNEVARQAIMADPHWNGGDYYGKAMPEMGLAVARMIAHITYLSDESMRRKFGRNLQDKSDFSFNFDVDFQVESYLRYQGSKFVRRFDANSFLYITKAADYFDLEASDGTSINTLNDSQTRFLVVSFTSDWLYPTYQSKELVKALKKNGLDVSFCEIEADCGHDAFLLPNCRLDSLIAGFLKGVAEND